MFLDPAFAHGAGTRTIAFKSSPYYAQLDQATGGLLSRHDSSLAPGGDETTPLRPGTNPDTGQSPDPARSAPLPVWTDDIDAPGEDIAQSDPLDEVRTGDGDVMVLLFAIFCDGVQLHQKSQSTTVVITLKCLDQPSWLVGKLISCFNVAFIGGPKEPTCLKDFVAIFLEQFAQFIAELDADASGASCCASVPSYILPQALQVCGVKAGVWCIGRCDYTCITIPHWHATMIAYLDAS